MYYSQIHLQCEACLKGIALNSNYCKNCGREVKNRRIKCMNCQKIIDYYATYCPSCGNSRYDISCLPFCGIGVVIYMFLMMIFIWMLSSNSHKVDY